MPNKSQGNVAVFWDLDTCSIHKSNSGYEVVDKIRLITQPLGTVRSFRGYADLTDLGAPSTLHLRSELQSSGVSLVDCPAIGCRSISSKTMIVDILTHAADNPPPTTFLVIAGNNDLAYAISVLRLRQYDVVLVCPKSRVGQHSQASLYLDWYHDILGTSAVVDDSQYPARDSQRPQPSMSDAGGSSMTAPNQDSPSSTPEQPQGRERVVHDHPLESLIIGRDSDGFKSPHPQTGNKDNTDPPPPTEPSLPNPPVAFDASQSQEKDDLGYLSTQPGTPIVSDPQRPSSAPPSYSSFSPAPSPSSEDLYVPSPSQPYRTPWYVQEHPFDEIEDDTCSDFHYPISQTQSPSGASASTVTPQNGLFVATSPFINSAPLPQVAVPPKFATAPTSLDSNAGPPFALSEPALPSVEPTRSIPPPMNSSPEVTSNDLTSPSSPKESTTPRVQPLSDVTSPTPPSILVPSRPTPPVTAVSLPLPPAQARPPAPAVLPDHFKPLVAKLQERRSQGDFKPFRPGLAAEMVSSHSGVMREVGASTFTQYVQVAEQAGVVELPGPEGGLWVALRPEFYDYTIQ